MARDDRDRPLPDSMMSGCWRCDRLEEKISRFAMRVVALIDSSRSRVPSSRHWIDRLEEL